MTLLIAYEADQRLIEGIVQLIMETVLCRQEYLLIASNRYPAELVKAKFLKLNYFHIEYVLDCLKANTTKVRNGKMDHTGSACLFDEVYCGDIDMDTANFTGIIDRYNAMVDYSLENLTDMEYCRKNMLRDNHCSLKKIQDGDIFDIGGVQVEAIAVPGTTKGSFAFYEPAENYCFTGDAVNIDVNLTNLDRDGFRSYAEVMRTFYERIKPDTILYSYHLPQPLSSQIVQNLALIAEEIADYKVQQDPPCESIFHGHKNDRAIRGHYINNTCIVYDRREIGLGDIPMDYMNCCYYSHEKWSEHIFTITINYSTVNRITLMLFVGNEKNLLIDSGHGIDKNLKDYVRKVAGNINPIILACTHVGIDHAGGALQFDEVYIHKNDIAKLPLPRNRRLVDVQPFANYNKEFEEYVTENMLESIQPEMCKEVKDEDIFELGGLSVRCIYTPGHSDGHMTYYCEAEKIAFTGDAMNIDTHLGVDSPVFYLDYARMLQSFMEKVDLNTMLFSGHLSRPNSMRVPLNLMAACIEIALGQTYGDSPAEAIQQHLYGAAYRNPNRRIHFHGNCCVIYGNRN